MTLTHKLLLAFATMLLSPSVIAFVASGHWSRDNIDIGILAMIYLLPLFLVALLLRALKARRVAAAVYILGMIAFLAFAIQTLWAELHGPIIGQIYIPTIVLCFPFGLMAILHRSTPEKEIL
jgi:hypothetical protein